MRMILNPFKLLKIGKKPTTPRKKLEIPKSPEQLIMKHGRLANQGELVIKSMLMIQESILDSDALQGYEALPEQITRIMYESYVLINCQILIFMLSWMRETKTIIQKY